ncbi:MAG: hypothetical protein WA954_05645 [Parerythrobacter sp.]
MATASYRSSAPDQWSSPRPYSDPSLRYRKYGAVLPMEEPGFFARIFARR